MESKIANNIASERGKQFFGPLSFGLGAVVILLVTKYKSKKSAPKTGKTQFNFNSLPGPLPSLIPFVGNALQLVPEKTVLPTLLKWSQNYGPVIRLELGPTKFVWLNSAEGIESLLKSTDPDHHGKPGFFHDKLKPFVNKSIFVTEGKVWKSRRKIMMRTLTSKSVRSYMPLLNKHAGRLVTKLEHLFGDSNYHEIVEPFDVSLFEVICEVTAGQDIYGTQMGLLFHQSWHTAQKTILARFKYPWLQHKLFWWLSSTSTRQEKAHKNFKMIINKLITNHGSKTPLADDDSRLRCLLDELTDEQMSAEQIFEELSATIIGGHDVPSHALMCFCFQMATNPEIQAKCHEEVDIFWENSDNFGEQGITFESLKNLNFLENCIAESMRLIPPALFYFRILKSPLNIDDSIELPTGTNVAVSAPIVHRNQKYYPNPNTFDPNRFTPEECAKRPKGAYIPFSLGPKVCIGYKLALVELRVMAAYILRNFSIKTTDFAANIPLVPGVFFGPEQNYLFQFVKRHN